MDCVFCGIIAGAGPANFVERGRNYVAFTPRRGHVPGHVLFVPTAHVEDATTDPAVTGLVFAKAAEYVRDELGGAANIITSVGSAATQTVFHLHVHVLPRGPEDGLRASWPWRVKPGEDMGPGEFAPLDWKPGDPH